MADKIQGDISGNVYVDFAYNNIIIVDPNKTQDNQGNVTERLVDHENLVMYANLEAELLPRTKLAIGATTDSIRTISIAKINMLAPNKGDYLSTNYYDELTGDKTIQGKGTNQTQSEIIPPSNGDKAYTKLTSITNGSEGSIDTGLLGMTSINIKISGAFIPSVDIELEDVQGRALFQLGENSPYAAFFHLPYPPFYLTLKGYYGQAIRYQLNLEKFSASFNSMNGNYRVSLKFKGYKFNILNEISVGHLLATPHMYSSRFDISNSKNSQPSSGTIQGAASQQSANIPAASNSSNNVTQQMFVEKGYQKIIEVYGEYKAKKIIDKNFPELTLKQLMDKLENFEKNIISNYSKTDVESLTNIREYQKVLKQLYGEVYANNDSWFNKNLNPKPFIEKITGIRYYAFKNEIDNTEYSIYITNLDGIIKKNNVLLNENKTLGIDAPLKITNPISITIITAITTSDSIDWVETAKAQGYFSPTVKDIEKIVQDNSKLFKPATLFSLKNLANSIGGETPFIPNGEASKVIEFIKPTFFIFDGKNKFIDVVQNMSADATKKLSDEENRMTIELKKKIEDPTTGIGFSPTVKNIVAVILASTEGFIRLLDEVHTKAWDVRYDPIRKNAILNNPSSAKSSDSKDLVQTGGIGNNQTALDNSQIPVYPWPQFFVETNEDKKGKFQLKYIADPSIINLTKGYMYDKWPEVEFVEEYIKGLTQKDAPINSPTPSSVQEFTNYLNINAIEFPQADVVYSNKEQVKFFYEIWERQFMTSRYENLVRLNDGSTEFDDLVKLLVQVESKNLLTSLGVSNPYLNSNLKNYKIEASKYVSFLKQMSNNGTGQSYIDFLRDIFVTPYIKSYTTNSFAILSVDEIGKKPATTLDDKRLENVVKSTKTNTTNVTDLYPFNNGTWAGSNLIDATSQNLGNQYNTTKSLKIYKERNVISNFTDLTSFNTNRPVTNFSYLNVQNPLSQSQSYASSQSGFLPNFYSSRVPTNFIPTEGYCYFDVPTNKNKSILNILTGDLPIQTTTSILNTPFFINSISDGVSKWKSGNEYPFISSAYLFINSLPLITLREKYKSDGTNLDQLDYMFATLKKFGGIHKLPYAWILKIGSIWHRYKTYKQSGVDILTNVWKSVDYKNSFDPVTNNPNKVYKLEFNGQTGNTIQLEYINPQNIVVQSGFYPKLINDFNYFYKGSNLYTTYSDLEIQSSINDGLKLYNFTDSNLNVTQNGIPLRYITWSVMLPGGNGYYFVPSFGGSQNQMANSLITQAQIPPLVSSQIVLPGSSITGNASVYNGSMRLLWSAPNYGYFDDSQIVKPSFDSYLNEIKGTSSLLSPFKLLNKVEYSKIEDIFSVFEKNILDTFEVEFQKFSKSVDKLEIQPTTNLTYGQQTGDPNLKFKNFQLLFRSLMIIDNPSGGISNESYFISSIESQLSNFSSSILKFLQYDVIFKYGNPSNYDRYIFDSFLSSNVNTTNAAISLIQTVQSIENSTLVNPKFFKPYLVGSLPSKNGTTTLTQSISNYYNEWRQLELSVGFSTIPELQYTNNGSYITDFFIDNNIEFSVENIKDLSSLIKMYATQKLITPTLKSTSFKKIITEYFTNCDKLQNAVLDGILDEVRKTLPNYQEVPEKTIETKVEGQQSKVNLYENVFKPLNDKWIAGGDYKSKTFFEDILFLDRASRNIGDTIYLDIFTLKEIINAGSLGMSVYTLIAGLLIRNNFTIMNLPAYVNFYNVQTVDGVSKPTGNEFEFADNMWGTFLNVDYRESGPKMVCFFVGRPSSYVELPESKNYLFRSDGITLERSSDNPLSEDQTNKKDYAQSNKCVGFTVDIGIRNQNVFSNFNITQDNGKGTSESVQTLVNMIDQTSGREVATQNVGLYNYYAQRSYGAQVVSLGNAMIQPTMYFNLRHVPMFNGPYFITDVSHVITPGSFQTTFNGTRQGIFDLPAIDSFLQSINQNLLTKLEKEVLNKTDSTSTSSSSSLGNSSKSTQTSKNTKAPDNSCSANTVYKGFTVTAETETIASEFDLVLAIKRAVPADADLQAIIYAICYLRTYKEGGFYGFNNNYSMISLSKNYGYTSKFFLKNYTCISSPTSSSSASEPIVHFKDIDTFIGFMVARIPPKLVIKIKDDIGLHQFYICEWDYITVNTTTFDTNRTSQLYGNSRDIFIKGLESAKANGIPVQNILKLVDGKNYQKINPTPTPTPTRPSLPSNTSLITLLRTKQGGNDIKIVIDVIPNVGLWRIIKITFNLPANSPVGIKDGTTGTIVSNLRWYVTPLLLAQSLNPTTTYLNGSYSFTFQITIEPINSDGTRDMTRMIKIENINSNVVIT
jgi:hypothetical protein